MPAGLQVYNESSQLILDLTDRVGKVIASGSTTFSSGTNVRTISVAGITDSPEYYVSCTGYVVCRINSGSFTLSRFDFTSASETQYWSVVKQ